MFIQEKLFRKALSEIGMSTKGLEISHSDGRVFHPDTGWIDLVFPCNLVLKVCRLPSLRKNDFFFSGTISQSREWVHDFPNVFSRNWGRNRLTKHRWDHRYWANLRAAKFALAPSGDYPWSYRFLEAIIAGAIPVLEDRDPDIFANHFHHIRYPSEPFVYRESLATENFRTLLTRHTLPFGNVNLEGLVDERLLASIRMEIKSVKVT